ncbi:sua5 related protein [Lentisphaera araneosa HTCC2155]|jgi:L-threonylcarbamoyladenylate synthase|uniref:Threonylcarbamoyl-AMP synthase n=1 Tax=Lentisphaera araneosa HTCC2155 TaxID=313628 RepID=A6DT40_9BACT|nr:L-threonylcarbamoyladenylate synthase [Lentisphaera araneosa]EDM25215.1 sua5 related protein [Lentisphaera araneosa HTCC2155]
MAIFRGTEENIKKAAEHLKNDNLVAFATETVYGLGANALSPPACEKIFKAKKRPKYDPLIVHIAEIYQLSDLVKEIPDVALDLAEAYWPGPLTLVFKKTDLIPSLITSGLDTVAIRMPAHPLALGLLSEAQIPVAAPSANPFGYLSPTSAEHVFSQLENEVDIILDGGECDWGIESTIVDCSSGEAILLRQGGISAEDIRRVTGSVQFGKAVLERPLAPGQLASHYAPNTKLMILKSGEVPNIADSAKVGFLQMGSTSIEATEIEVLSENEQDFKSIAHNLFSALHRLDSKGLDVIYVYELEGNDLASAIMDRLLKAAAKRS